MNNIINIFRLSKEEKANNRIYAIRGSKTSAILILKSLSRGEKITNHDTAKFRTNSVKDIIGDLRRNYGLNILGEWKTNQELKMKYKQYFIDMEDKNLIEKIKSLIAFIEENKTLINAYKRFFN
ncbi:MAG: hypothetical protein K5978_06310 [Campylobacter sp.]|nr:hypothetical protein [Campylobacter sp.]